MSRKLAQAGAALAASLSVENLNVVPRPPLPAPEDELLVRLRQAAQAGKKVMVKLSSIVIEDNVRQTVVFDENFEALVMSVKAKGVRETLELELEETSRGYKLKCLSGQRRLLAAARAREELRRAGQGIEHLEAASAIIEIYQRRSERIWTSIEANDLRADLTPMDAALAYKQIYEALVSEGAAEHGLPGQIAARVGMKPKTMRGYLKLGSLPETVTVLIKPRPELFNVALLWRLFVDVRLENEEQALAITKKVILAAEGGKPPQKTKEQGTDFTRAGLQGWAKVKFSGSQEKGKMTLSWNNEAEFATMLAKLKLKLEHP